MPPWIPILFTKDVLAVQRALWSDLGERVKIMIVSFSRRKELREPIPVGDFIKRVINELKARIGKANTDVM